MDIKKDTLPIAVEAAEAASRILLLLMMMNTTGVILILDTKGLDRHRQCRLLDTNTEVENTSITALLKINTTVAEMIRKTFVRIPELLHLSSEPHASLARQLPSTCPEQPTHR
jgi:hypothetical protein